MELNKFVFAKKAMLVVRQQSMGTQHTAMQWHSYNIFKIQYNCVN